LLAQHHGAPRPARVELRGQLRRQLTGNPAHLVAALAGVNGDRVGIVLVARLAPERECLSRSDVLLGQCFGVVLSGARDRSHVQSSLSQRGIVAREKTTCLGLDDAVTGEPDLASLVGIPVALLVFDVDDDGGTLGAPHPE
jgi:hypothetical protein